MQTKRTQNQPMRCEDGDKVVKSKTKSLWDWD